MLQYSIYLNKIWTYFIREEQLSAEVNYQNYGLPVYIFTLPNSLQFYESFDLSRIDNIFIRQREKQFLLCYYRNSFPALVHLLRIWTIMCACMHVYFKLVVHLCKSNSQYKSTWYGTRNMKNEFFMSPWHSSLITTA